eukprot:403357567
MLEFFKQIDVKLIEEHPILKQIIKEYYVNSLDQDELARQITMTLCEFISDEDQISIHQQSIDTIYLYLCDLIYETYPLYNEFLLAFEDEMKKLNSKITNKSLSEVLNRLQLIFQKLDQCQYLQQNTISVKGSCNHRDMQKQIDVLMFNILKVFGRCFDLREIMNYECFPIKSKIMIYNTQLNLFNMTQFSSRSLEVTIEHVNIVEYFIKSFAYQSAFYFIDELHFDIDYSLKFDCHNPSILYKYLISLVQIPGKLSDLDKVYAKMLMRESNDFSGLTKAVKSSFYSFKKSSFINNQAKKRIALQVYKKYYLLMKIQDYSKGKVNKYMMNNILSYGKIEWFNEIDIYVDYLKQDNNLLREEEIKFESCDFEDDDSQKEEALMNKLQDLEFQQQQPKTIQQNLEGIREMPINRVNQNHLIFQ